MRILPHAQRIAMYEIYSFCKQVDTIADGGGPQTQRLEALRQWRNDINRLYEQGTRSDTPPHLTNLAWSIDHFSLDQDDFIAIIDGMNMDVETTIVAPDTPTLDLYCDRVASAVGRLSVKVFGMPKDSGRELAHHLGRALQLTNILRDIDEDAMVGRVYLPHELLLAAGLDHATPATIQANTLDGACAPLVAQARTHFGVSRDIMRRSARRVVVAPAIMAASYEALLDKLVRRGFAPPRERVRVSKLSKAWFALTQLLQSSY